MGEDEDGMNGGGGGGFDGMNPSDMEEIFARFVFGGGGHKGGHTHTFSF